MRLKLVQLGLQADSDGDDAGAFLSLAFFSLASLSLVYRSESLAVRASTLASSLHLLQSSSRPASELVSARLADCYRSLIFFILAAIF